MPLLAYSAFAAWTWSRHGIPVLGDRLLPWLLGFLVVVSLSDVRRLGRVLALEWLPLFVALTTYDLLRGIADGRLFPAHARPQMWVDKYLFGFGTVPTVWLQRHLWDPAHLHWHDYLSWAIYISHFVSTPVLLVAPATRTWCRR